MSRTRNPATHVTRSRQPDIGERAQYRMETYTDKIAEFVCGVCQGGAFRVITSMDGPLMQLVCLSPRCPGKTKVLEMRKVEMTESIAKQLGLWTPSMSPGPAIDTEIEVEQ